MDLTIVIPARNEELRLGAQLDALLAQEWDGEWEIIVVDNLSTDGTADLVHRYARQSPRVRYLYASERGDKAYAVGVGVAASTARAVAICDGDDVVAEGWLAAMTRGLEQHRVVTGPNELDELNPRWLADSRGRGDEEPVGSFCGIFPVVRGNNYGVRTEIWRSVGPLEQGAYPVEDIEFSLRCWLNGIEVVGLPDAIVHYRYRESARDLWRQGFSYGSARPMIARRLRDAGKPRPPHFAGWKSWLLLVVTIPTVVTRTGRARWLWIAGNRFGQVAGSVRHRIVML